MCAWYAARSDKPEENLAAITIKQSVRPGGAGISFFWAAPGPMQLARLYREDGKYKMAIMDEFIEARGPHQLPTMFTKMDYDIDAFVEEYGSNHISGVAGCYTEELVEVCKMLDIEPVVFART